MTTLSADLASALDPVRFACLGRFAAEDWQANLMRTMARRVLVRCSRQVGKTTTTAWKALHVATYTPGALVLIISPALRQSTEMLKTIKSMHRAVGAARLVKDNESEMEFSNGSRIVSLPGVEGTIRGFAGANLIVLDEAARIDDDILASAMPMVASDGAIWALSTPWGRRGWFFDLHDTTGNGWERHTITCYESGQWDPSRIAEMKASVGRFTFASDYECVFGDTDSQLFSLDDIRAAFTPSVQPLFALTGRP